MRVDVLRIQDPDQGIVFFGCESGSASGRWMGQSPPQPGSFLVEFEISDEITEWTAVSAGGTTLSEGPDSVVRIECEVAGIHDEVVEVRLGPDIVVLEIPHRTPDLAVGARISFRTPEILLYPYVV